jgi:hypothetical protein
LAAFAPGIEGELRVAADSDAWKVAANQHDWLWQTRLVAKECDGDLHCRVVFKGAKLLLVEAESKERFTFRFDTSLLPQNGLVVVRGLWMTSVGTRRAKIMRVGAREFQFNEEGCFESYRDLIDES